MVTCQIKMKNGISGVLLGFETNFTFYSFDNEKEREVTFLCACF